MNNTKVATIVFKEASSLNTNILTNTLKLTKDIKVLSKDRAYDIIVDHTVKYENVLNILKSNGIAADLCIQNTQRRRKKLLICDMDSTLIGQECIDELADFAGVKTKVSEITERAMRGEIDFEGALIERVSLLEGLDISVLQKCFDERISINAGAQTLCKTMKLNGAKTVIVSGGFTFFTKRVSEACGFETNHANVLKDDGSTLTGKVSFPILGRDAKRDALKFHSQSIGGPNSAIAIGDGANDLAMIQTGGLGIAYYAKPTVAEASPSSGLDAPIPGKSIATK